MFALSMHTLEASLIQISFLLCEPGYARSFLLLAGGDSYGGGPPVLPDALSNGLSKGEQGAVESCY